MRKCEWTSTSSYVKLITIVTCSLVHLICQFAQILPFSMCAIRLRSTVLHFNYFWSSRPRPRLMPSRHSSWRLWKRSLNWPRSRPRLTCWRPWRTKSVTKLLWRSRRSRTRREAVSPPDHPPFKGPRSAPRGRLPVSLAQILVLKIKKHHTACGVKPLRLRVFVTWKKQKGDALLWSGVKVETPSIQGPREGSRFQIWYLKVCPNFPLRKILPPSLPSFLPSLCNGYKSVPCIHHNLIDPFPFPEYFGSIFSHYKCGCGEYVWI